MLIYVVLLLNVLTCQRLVCNLLHMTAPSAPTSLPTVLHGVPVVAGVQYGRVIRPGRAPALDDVDAAPEVDEEDRPAEAARFTAAAGGGAPPPRGPGPHPAGRGSPGGGP